MLTTVEGIYKDGAIELAEKPQDLTESRVLVTFLPASNGTPPKVAPKQGQMYHGMFPQFLEPTDEDFKAAEFHGDPDDGLDWT